jgi:predicted transcriptional regulator of viral defense system
MCDPSACRPDYQCLADTTSTQSGYFTNRDAARCGFSRSPLEYHDNTGRFVRVRRGVYRFRETPSSTREEVISAWLAADRDVAVISHETALDLHDLSDVIPNVVHLTLPRSRRGLRSPPGVVYHTSSRPLTPKEITVREGLRVTAPVRTVLDAADAGTAPEQIELASQPALDRGLASPSLLREQAHHSSRRVRELVESGIRMATR